MRPPCYGDLVRVRREGGEAWGKYLGAGDEGVAVKFDSERGAEWVTVNPADVLEITRLYANRRAA